jgi:tetratricopeptide (TPR) repeat protein
MSKLATAAGFLVLLVCARPTVGSGQSLALARRLGDHGLSNEAKREFISVVQAATASAADKAEALYQLGQLSFAEGRYKTALADWAELQQKFPASQQAKDLSDRLAQLREVVQNQSDESISNAVAASYLRNADFWSDAPDKFTIDASWLPKVELAVTWYDRVIKEYPQSDVAGLAYGRKLRALLGWREATQYGSNYGTKASFAKYMPMVLSTFDEFAKSFPTDPSLQAFRFQIAQAYWTTSDVANTRLWLQRVVDEAKDQQTFYSELAKARLACKLDTRGAGTATC